MMRIMFMVGVRYCKNSALPFWATALLAMLMPAAPSLSAQAISFTEGHFPAGGNASYIVQGDFNGDGNLDVAVSNWTGFVSVMLGNGDGTFQSPRTVPVGADPRGLAAADFNGDGKLDLAVPNTGSHSISVLLGNGDGTFQPPINYQLGDLLPVNIAVADFNGDGRPDMAVTTPTCLNGACSTGYISVFIGNGDGTFQPRVDYVAGAGPQAIVTGDFNNDGIADIAVTDTNRREFSVFLGRGDGTFQTPQTYPLGTFNPYSMVAGDFNGDGKLDLVITNTTDSLSIFFGNGDGTFGPRQSVYVGQEPSFVVAADFNNDGILDLAVPGTGVAVVLGRGDGTFQPPKTFGGGGNLVAGDFNNDGNLDLVGVLGDLRVLLGFGDGTFSSTGPYVLPNSTSMMAVNAIAIGDLNGDGVPDVVMTSFRKVDFGTGNYGAAALGNEHGGFHLPYEVRLGNQPTAIALGDFNGDGKLDLAVTRDNCNYLQIGPCTTRGEVAILLGNGDGTFQPSSGFTVGIAPSSLVLGDFNGDGKLDVAVTNPSSNTVTVLLGRGDGLLDVAQTITVQTTPVAVVAADFNGDGRLDLATANSDSNNVSILLGNGDGTFQAPTNNPTGSHPVAMALGDFNGDGRPDIVTSNLNSDNVSVLLGNGDGTLGAPVSTVAGTYLAAIGVGDFDGDGKLDVAVINSHNDKIALLLGNGDGTLRALQYLSLPTPKSFVVYDFNGDGLSDLAIGFDRPAFTVLINNTQRSAP